MSFKVPSNPDHSMILCSFFPLFFHPAFVKVVHFLPRHQASRRALPFEETQRSVKEKKEEAG